MWSPGGWGETHSTCEALLALQEKTIPALLPLPLFRAFMNLHGVAPGDRDAFAKRVWALRQAAMQSTNTAYACAMGDQLDAGIARYLAGAAKRSPLVRQNALAALLEWSGPNDTALLARKTPEEELTSSNSVLNLTETVFRKSLEEAPFHGGVAIPIRNLRHLDGLRGKLGSAAADARIDAVAERQMVALGEGARRLGSHPRMHAIAVNAAEKALARGDGRALSALCHAVAEIFDRSDQNQQLTLIAELNQASRWETAYLLADAILRRNPDASPDFARLRTEAAAHMTGVYPVAENDPTFPLYVAADELLLGRNTERAWFLLNRNLAVFEKDPLRYPPLFIAWAVEQLRNARGDRAAMLDKAAALVDAMPIKEKQLPDELAASLMLTKAEIARDRRRFDTAHLDYQAIRNHPAYQKTSAGRKAMFLFENFVEDRDGRPRRELDAAYRIRPGDALLIQVSDPDMDATPEADAVAVQVSAGDQPPLTLSAVEERDPGAPEGVETYVGGVFHALLKTVDASDAAAVAAEAVLGELELQGSPQVVREAKRLRAYLYKDRMGKFEKAIGYFNEAVDPPESLWGVQECLWRLGRKDEAQAMLGEIVGAFPKDAPRAMFQKAEYFRLDGEKASAIACYRRILSNPEWSRSGEASRATPRPSKFPVFAASPPTGRRRSCS